jgi:hypothetical protein
MKPIHLSEQAFLGMILASAEVYRRECYGLLVGRGRRGETRVAGAIAYQTAERKFSEVLLHDRPNRVIQDIVGRFPKHAYVGEFHSHPDYRGCDGIVGLTRVDVDGVRAGEIQVVIAIHRRRRRVRWAARRDGTLSGTLGGYHFKIGGYEVRAPRGPRRRVARGKSGRRRRPPRFVRARLVCPYAVGPLNVATGREK